MPSLEEFRSRLEASITAIQNEPRWTPSESMEFMAGIEAKQEQFQFVAEHLISVIRPRLALVASRFRGEVASNDPPGQCSCWFPSRARFPVSAKVGFVIEHDAHFDRVVLGYEMYLMPVFIKYKDKDRLTLSNREVPDDKVANWSEDRLLDFVCSYLQIDRGAKQSEKIATDPCVECESASRMGQQATTTMDTPTTFVLLNAISSLRTIQSNTLASRPCSDLPKHRNE